VAGHSRTNPILFWQAQLWQIMAWRKYGESILVCLGLAKEVKTRDEIYVYGAV